VVTRPVKSLCRRWSTQRDIPQWLQ